MQKMENPAKTYTGIYGMHKYWSKKPFNLVRELILKNSKPGDIVLDTFCGSGISIIESILTGRKAVGIDLNPSSIFITEQSISKINPDDMEKEYQRIQSEISNKINQLYKVKRGKKSYIGTHCVWKLDKLSEVWYKDEKNEKVIDFPSKEDINLSDSFSYKKIEHFFPKDTLIENSRINVKPSMHVYDLFTPRNLLALSLLKNIIESIEDKQIRNIFKFCFTASLGQASKMVFVIHKRGKVNGKTSRQVKEIGSWVIGYWIPKENFEINVWNCFTNRYRRILKAKIEQFSYDYELKTCKNFSELKTGNILLINDDALAVLKKLDDYTIDYVITDPPHGDRIPYLELSLMWNSWLKLKADFESELIISDAKKRQKSTKEYGILFTKIMKEIARVLKKNKTFTLMFNSLDNDTWKNIIEIVNNTDLKLEKIGTIGYSANSVVQDNRKRGLKSDFVLNFIKSEKEKPIKSKTLPESEERKLIQTLIRQFKMENKQFEVYKVMNFVIISLLEKGYSFNISNIIDLIDLEK